jgi:outer membrane protein OmpA-like peptidoglycan-associated protein
MTARGVGESAPVAPNEKPDGADDPEGRQKNRRVQITVNTE